MLAAIILIVVLWSVICFSIGGFYERTHCGQNQ